MTPIRKTLGSALALYVALFAFAFVASPYSCEWGLSAYFFVGLAVLLASTAAPFALAPELGLAWRVLMAGLLLTAGVGAWFAGLIVANVRVVCRLF